MKILSTHQYFSDHKLHQSLETRSRNPHYVKTNRPKVTFTGKQTYNPDVGWFGSHVQQREGKGKKLPRRSLQRDENEESAVTTQQ